MKYTTRQIILLGLLAGLNAVLEFSLGTYFHALKLPWRGALMVGINTVIYFVGRKFAPQTGSIFLMGLITAFIRLLLPGNIGPFPLFAIVTEALMIEVFISVLGFRLASVILSGVIVNIFSFFYPFFGFYIVSGNFELFTKISKNFLLFLVIPLTMHIIIGIVFSLLSWSAILGLEKRKILLS